MDPSSHSVFTSCGFMDPSSHSVFTSCGCTYIYQNVYNMNHSVRILIELFLIKM